MPNTNSPWSTQSFTISEEDLNEIARESLSFTPAPQTAPPIQWHTTAPQTAAAPQRTTTAIRREVDATAAALRGVEIRGDLQQAVYLRGQLRHLRAEYQQALLGRTPFRDFTSPALEGSLANGAVLDEFTQVQKARRRQDIKNKLRRQLDGGVGRRYRFGGYTRTDIPDRIAACAWSGRIKAFKIAHMKRHLSGSSDAITAYLKTRPMYEEMPHHERDVLLGEYGLGVRVCADRVTSEWASLAYTILNTEGMRVGSYPYLSRHDVEKERDAGHYIDDASRVVVRVPKEEWGKWPRLQATRVRGYKRFAVGEEVIETPWTRLTLVRAPVTGKQYESSGLESCVASYHNASNRGSYAKLSTDVAEDVYTFGCEIEIVPGATHHRNAAAAEILEEMGSKLDIERDGSVPRGFEIVSGFGTFEALDEMVKELYSKFLTSRHDVYRATDQTGLHFHVGRKSGISLDNIKRMYVLESLFGQLTNTVSGRAGNNYCRRLARYVGVLSDYPLVSLLANSSHVEGDRYSSFNATGWNNSGGTRFEWRSCKSTTSYAAWRARIEYLRVLLQWADDGLMKDAALPTIDEFLTRVMDAPRNETVGLRRTLKLAATGRLLTEMGATVPVAYNGRTEYRLVNI